MIYKTRPNPWVRLATRATRSTAQVPDASGESPHLYPRPLVTRPGGCWTGLMTTPSRRPDKDGPVAPPVPGGLGVPADSVGRAPGGRLKDAIRRWWQQRQLRRTERLERRVTARENLRDFKTFTGDEPGAPGGGG
jgi:hypothetical protein